MNIKVIFYSYFRELTGCCETVRSLPGGASLGHLLEDLRQAYPRLREMERSTLVAVGVEYQGPDHLLTDGDEVSLFPPVKGG